MECKDVIKCNYGRNIDRYTSTTFVHVFKITTGEFKIYQWSNIIITIAYKYVLIQLLKWVKL